ncbi:MAG: hypothetical protein BRC43_15635 [Cyanobacteria bacterium QS_3_48_167]|nr:MAG: hypothetical protein BRC43_15635 [Cyanobacteria bacterium QS_3_48_167]
MHSIKLLENFIKNHPTSGKERLSWGESPLPRHSEDLGGVFRFDQEVEALLPYRWVGKLQSHERGSRGYLTLQR